MVALCRVPFASDRAFTPRHPFFVVVFFRDVCQRFFYSAFDILALGLLRVVPITVGRFGFICCARLNDFFPFLPLL